LTVDPHTTSKQYWTLYPEKY